MYLHSYILDIAETIVPPTYFILHQFINITLIIIRIHLNQNSINLSLSYYDNV